MNHMMIELFVGQIARLQRRFTEEDVQICNQLTGDFNQVYGGKEAIWENPFQKPIVPGLLSEGLITQVITERQPGCPCLLLQKDLIFSHPVFVGNVITAELEIIGINLERKWVTQKVTCFNQEGIEVIKGQVVLLILTDFKQCLY